MEDGQHVLEGLADHHVVEAGLELGGPGFVVDDADEGAIATAEIQVVVGVADGVQVFVGEAVSGDEFHHPLPLGEVGDHGFRNCTRDQVVAVGQPRCHDVGNEVRQTCVGQRELDEVRTASGDDGHGDIVVPSPVQKLGATVTQREAAHGFDDALASHADFGIDLEGANRPAVHLLLRDGAVLELGKKSLADLLHLVHRPGWHEALVGPLDGLLGREGIAKIQSQNSPYIRQGYFSLGFFEASSLVCIARVHPCQKP